MFQENEFFICEDSGLINIEGLDRFKFIQGIISNDIEILKKKPSIYSSILTPQGKFLYDFFLSNYDNEFILETKKKNIEDLVKRLALFKLRSDVTITNNTNLKIVLTKGKIKNTASIANASLSFLDPRFKNFFFRSYVEKENINLLKKNLQELTSKKYNELRIEYSIPDFTLDSIIEKSLLLEMRFDQLNGISWTKGCYLGQEITARMKHRKIVKKKIYKVIIDYKTNIKKDLISNDKIVGELFSHTKKYGLAYIKTDFLDNKGPNIINSGDSRLTIDEPWWAKKN